MRKQSKAVTKARAGLIPESDWRPQTVRLSSQNDDGKFVIPDDIRKRARASDIRIRIKASTLIALMDEADTALNGDSNDAEHDALFSIREQLSDLFESGDQ